MSSRLLSCQPVKTMAVQTVNLRTKRQMSMVRRPPQDAMKRALKKRPNSINVLKKIKQTCSFIYVSISEIQNMNLDLRERMLNMTIRRKNNIFRLPSKNVIKTITANGIEEAN